MEKNNDNKIYVIAGPCSAENPAQVMQTSTMLARGGKVDMLRFGVWKPRTSPREFQGVGAPALQWIADARRATGLPVCIEVGNARHIDMALKYRIDMVWIGARTTVNPFSVQEIADALRGTDIRVGIKNPMYPDIKLWCGAVERVAEAVGMRNIRLIHRGFFTREGRYRNDPDWESLESTRAACPDLPVICDPSHMAGRREYVAELAREGLRHGASALMIESHPDPSHALSDARQQLTPDDLGVLLERVLHVNA